MFGTFPILRPIFHVMKNVGRVILEECKGQARICNRNSLVPPWGNCRALARLKGASLNYLSASEQSNLGKQLFCGLIKCTGGNCGKNHTGEGCGGEYHPVYTGNLPQYEAGSEGSERAADSNGKQISSEQGHGATGNNAEYHLYKHVDDVVHSEHHTEHTCKDTCDNVAFKAEAGADEYGDWCR